jgi:hypothetical protein
LFFDIVLLHISRFDIVDLCLQLVDEGRLDVVREGLDGARVDLPDTIVIQGLRVIGKQVLAQVVLNVLPDHEIGDTSLVPLQHLFELGHEIALSTVE